MKRIHRGRAGRTIPVLLVLVMLLCSIPAMAAGSELELSTPYPGQSAKAGDNLTYSVTLHNGTEQGLTAELSAAVLPEGWEGYFEGSGTKISHIYAKAGGDATASFSLSIPAETQDGIYTVVLEAESGSYVSQLKLTLDVSAEEIGSSALTTQYASQEGASDTGFTFSTTVQNNTPNEQTYSLTANLPAGWSISFFPAGEQTQVAAITVPARSSQSVDVAVTPVAGVEAGEFKIPVSAISATETLETELSVTITGTYILTLSTPSGRLSFDAVANEQSAVTLSLYNQGNVDLQNVNLTSSAPDGWTVEFSESTVEILEAGAAREITAYVTPSEDAMSGDYALQLSAKTTETSDSADFRVTVKTQTVWGVVGIGLIAVAVLGLWLVFRKFGRR